MPAGRPLKFESVEELEVKIQEYFKSCWGKKLDMFGNPVKDKETKEQVLELKRPYTISGLAAALGCDRDTLLNYEAREEYFGTIKAAKAKIHALWEERLYGGNATGAIFNLKNNWGWEDKTGVDHTTKGKELPTPILGGLSNAVSTDNSDPEASPA